MTQRRLWREPSFDLIGKIARINWLYVTLLGLLAAIGYAALFSAAGGQQEPYAARHAIRFGFGLVLMLGIALIDIRLIARLAWPAWFGGMILLLLVSRMGHVGKGAQRWIDLGGFQLQPSELMKIALVLALAHWFRRASWERMGNPVFLLPPIMAVLIPAALILKQPNLGTAVITLLLGAAMFFAAGVRWWKFVLVALPIPFLAKFGYDNLRDYQRARIDTFLHPENDPLGAGYNIIQSKITLGSGGLWGKGYLNGTQGHLDFLPEKQTDFIFSIIGEEVGFAGALLVMGVLAAIVLGGMLIALRARHQFGRLVALGISFNFFLYVFVNIAMVMGAIPVGGVPLPLISHGGSAVITVMIGFGILMSVHVHRDVEFDDAPDDR
jgi:rod shape determining protein RodA